jgi:hypothetical protein
MNKLAIFILVIMAALYGCVKDNNEASSFSAGTYSGIKSIYYPDTHIQSIDTITIKFGDATYTYSGSNSLDFGRGGYLLKKNAIEFNDYVARNALYTWEWIIGGTFQSETKNDSLILIQKSAHLQITCKLQKVTR